MRVEWPTVFLILVCYLVWAVAIFLLPLVWLPLAIVVTGLAIALHSSLQHEVTHGHPFPARWVSEAVVFPSLNLAIPFIRFRDQHLAHHNDATLTDPYDDPETNFLDPEAWDRLPAPIRAIFRLNNTLLGRLLIGPALSQITFMMGDWRMIRGGDRAVLWAWVAHGLSILPILALIVVAPMPVWAYLIAAYIGLAIVKIRTFLEHQAHERASGRTVVIEDRGLLAFLFLNNNLHVVHHMHPRLPWYRLPRMYRDNRARYLARNGGYIYRSYGEIFRQHLFRAKDPVPHPLYRAD